MTLHLPRSSVAGEDLSASSLEHERILDGLLGRVKDTELGGDGDVEVKMKDVD